jgi:hypothetical protein
MSTVMILPPSPANAGRTKVDDYCAARSEVSPPLPWPTFPPPFSMFAAVHSSVHNHFNQDRSLSRREHFKTNRAVAIAERRALLAA